MPELNDVHANAILVGTVEGALIMKYCDARTRIDGVPDIGVGQMAASKAERLAEKANGDPKVAYAIARILYAATVLYGNVGETFLKEKLQNIGEDFSLIEYTHAIAESVLKRFSGKRKEMIIQGINDALSNHDNTEVRAAKFGILINEYMFKGIHDHEFRRLETKTNADYSNGHSVQIQDLQEILCQSKYGEVDQSTALHNLSIVYAYLKDHPTRGLLSDYVKIYPEISEEKRLAYYIANLSCEKVELILSLSNAAHADPVNSPGNN